MITIFDVCNKMPPDTLVIFKQMAGGKQVGKGKNKNAVIEVLVDNDTFQDFAFQQTYGEPKNGKSLKYFMLFAIDKDEYDKQLALLNSEQGVQESDTTDAK